MAPHRREPLDPEDFRSLPVPTRLEDTVTSEDTVEVAPEENDELREVHWVIRTTGF